MFGLAWICENLDGVRYKLPLPDPNAYNQYIHSGIMRLIMLPTSHESDNDRTK